MSIQLKASDIEVDVVRLDSDIIDEHLRHSTAVLHDIMYEKTVVASNGYKCDKCGKSYKTKSTLRSHCSLKHPVDELEAHCMLCDKTYPSVLSLQKHITYMHRYKNRCKSCYRSFASVNLLFAHEKVCSNATTPCSVCGKSFKSNLAVRNHMKYKHPESEDHRCGKCYRAFTTDEKLANHMATVHPPGKTTCTYCNRTFCSIAALQSHIFNRHTRM